MELLDLYDDEGKLLGITIERGSKFEKGNIMLSLVFIKNKDGKFLIQKTSKEKGSKYSSTGGHVIHGENGIDTILRELKEELGLNVKEDEVKSIAFVKHPKRPCFINLYLLEKDVDINSLVLQKEEVDSVYWMTKEEIISLIKEGNFIDSHGYLFEKYFKN